MMCLITGALSPWGPLSGWPTHFKLRSYAYAKSCLQKFVFAAPQLPSTGPNLLGERLRFSSTSEGWWRVNQFR